MILSAYSLVLSRDGRVHPGEDGTDCGEEDGVFVARVRLVRCEEALRFGEKELDRLRGGEGVVVILGLCDI
jgi:hypothetical protein